MRNPKLLMLFLLLAALPRAADATVIVSLDPSAASIAPSDTLELELRADLSQDTVVGFGLDLVFDASVLSLESVAIAAPWDAAFAADGDDLAAFAPLAGAPAGTDVLLATVTLRGIAGGESSLWVAATPADLTEGFPLAAPPGAFADFSSATALVMVPEPSPAFLLLLSAAVAGLVGRTRRTLGVLALLAAGSAQAQTTVGTPACAGGEALGEGIGVVASASLNEKPMRISRDGSRILVDLLIGGVLVEIGEGGRVYRDISGHRSPADLADDGTVIVNGESGDLVRFQGNPGPSGDLCNFIGCEDDPTISGDSVGVNGISSDGNIVAGAYSFDTGIPGTCTGFLCIPPYPNLTRSHPYVWSLDGGFVPLEVNATLDNYNVLGLSADGTTTFGFQLGLPAPSPTKQPIRWDGTALEYLEAPLGCTIESGDEVRECPSTPVGISADGSVVAGTLDERNAAGQSTRRAVIWKDGRAIRLGTLPGASSSEATAISDDGRLVVGQSAPSTGSGLFIWDEDNGMRLVEDFFGEQNVAGLAEWTSLTAEPVVDIRTDTLGEIVMVGQGYNETGAKEIWRAIIPCMDSDQDRLCDTWERMGGIDLDGDGAILPGVDVLLPDADPQYKDLYIEIDAMAGAGIPASDLVRVVQAFNNVPSALIPNPDGSGGIELHPVIDEVNIPSADHTPSLGVSCDPAVGSSEVDQIVGLRFGSPLERQTPGVVEVKQQVYRYALISPALEAGKAGQGLIGGPILLMREHSSPQSNAIVFMHELGHLLGLRHGGFENTNYKPNYKSLMNYTWQWPGDNRNAAEVPMALKAYQNSWRLDFSRVTYPPLFEGGIAEAAGIGGNPRSFVPVGPVLARIAPEVGPYDFDRDGQIGPDLAMANVNWLRDADPGASNEVLLGQSDWPVIGSSLCSAFGSDAFKYEWDTSCGAAVSSAAAADTAGADIPVEITQEIRDELGAIDYIDCNQNGVVDDDDLTAGLDTDSNDNGVLDGCEPLPGDIDGDEDVDGDDRNLLMAAFGRGEGEPEFAYLADLDQDQWITFVDYQLWLAAYEDFQAAQAAGSTAIEGCGLLGAEALAPLAFWALVRRRKARRSLDA
jgi:hypothetical protein